MQTSVPPPRQCFCCVSLEQFLQWEQLFVCFSSSRPTNYEMKRILWLHFESWSSRDEMLRWFSTVGFRVFELFQWILRYLLYLKLWNLVNFRQGLSRIFSSPGKSVIFINGSFYLNIQLTGELSQKNPDEEPIWGSWVDKLDILNGALNSDSFRGSNQNLKTSLILLQLNIIMLIMETIIPVEMIQQQSDIKWGCIHTANRHRVVYRCCCETSRK